MREELASPLGLIAGNGTFPLEFAECAKKRGISVFAVAHLGETEPRLAELVEECHWVKVGAIGKLLRLLKGSGVKQVAFAGGIVRVRLLRGFKPDLKGISLLTRVRSLKDDAILRAVAAEVEALGIKVISAGELLEQSVPREGTLTQRGLSHEEERDARRGWEAAKGIGALDIGQSVVVRQDTVVAVETAEGTDAAIERGGVIAGTAGKSLGHSGCVVVKVAKPQQDLRIDLPAIGEKTIEVMRGAGATALVIEAGRAALINPDQTIRDANRAGIAVVAWSELPV